MNTLNILLESSTLPAWVTTSIPVIRYVFLGIMGLAALTVLIAIMFQTSSNNESSNVITGSYTESFYAQNKSGTTSGRLKKVVVVLSIIIAVLAVLYFLSFLIYAGA